MSRVVVTGACGRMGGQIIRAVRAEQGLTLVGATEREGFAPGLDAGAAAGSRPLGVPVATDLAAVLARGADAALVVTPYYNKPTQEGLYRHYLAVYEASRFPIVVYNVPSRTSGDILPETVARLVKAGAVVGIKEATANMDRQVQLVEKVGKDAISYLSGDDFTVLPYVACGGHGVISVVANIAPRAMKDLVSAALRGDFGRALERQVAMAELNRALFLETNPGPVKAAVALLGRAGPEIRLPLVMPAEASVAKVRDAMARFGLPLA